MSRGEEDHWSQSCVAATHGKTSHVVGRTVLSAGLEKEVNAGQNLVSTKLNVDSVRRRLASAEFILGKRGSLDLSGWFNIGGAGKPEKRTPSSGNMMPMSMAAT